MTVLVTGATGNIGRPLVRRLLAGGHRVRALTRDPARADLPAGAEVAAGNLSDTASLEAAFAGVTAVHLIGFGDDYRPLENGPQIVELAVEAGVRKATVLRGELEETGFTRAVKAGGLEWTDLMPVEFMSNTLEWADSVRGEGVVRDGFPTAKSAMVHDADVAAVAAAVLTGDGHAGRRYLLTGPQALTPPEKVRVISEVLGREVGYVETSRDDMVELWRGQGFGDSDIAFFLQMRTDPPEAGYTVLPTVQQVTGRPARTFAQWVGEHAAAFTG
ncbi:NAD(P)H-binding protein [Streptomonospora sp. PA3]|uniref:NmrA family NAD(P)-binding protein n=1 Tax=Streptomonospora sp. PA3 TaxID=2607326 RepID=UPI0012DF4E0A|nr:NmrA family NAD(P)-binding protein [Streptomonospora sp. PA3]MUL41749.1 NAD(P)H-binding protein [Streptomonospora sp. PA3]